MNDTLTPLHLKLLKDCRELRCRPSCDESFSAALDDLLDAELADFDQALQTWRLTGKGEALWNEIAASRQEPGR